MASKIIGLVIIVEAIGALMWPKNDKTWIGQGARVTRIICGVTLLFL